MIFQISYSFRRSTQAVVALGLLLLSLLSSSSSSEVNGFPVGTIASRSPSISNKSKSNLLSKQIRPSFHYGASLLRFGLYSAGGDDEIEDDDGWGDSSTTTTPESPSEDSRLAELEQLKQQRSTGKPSQQQTRMTKNTDEPERDLFIPIFVLVSIAGFTGLYGYEMWRLAQEGSLYTPWR